MISCPPSVYNPARLPKGRSLDDVDIRLVVTDLCVLDFGGAGHRMRLVPVAPGNDRGAGAGKHRLRAGNPAEVPVTVAPTAEQLAIIAALDPHNQRAQQIRDNPPGDRSGG